MENRKIRLTKRLIKEALIELLRDKNIEQITVKELSEKADINRSTFYTHYCDVYAVLEEVSESFMKHIPFSVGEIRSSSNELADFFTYCMEHRDICLALMKTGFFRKYIAEESKNIFENGTLQNGNMKDTDEKIYLAMSAYTCAGTENFLLFCLENNVGFSAEDYGRIFYDINEYCKNAVMELSDR